MPDLDPAAVMAAHQPERYERTLDGGKTYVDGEWCQGHGRRDFPAWPCEPYRLAEALAAERAKVTMSMEDLDPIIEHLITDGTRMGLIHGDNLNRQMGRSARRAALKVTGSSRSEPGA